MIDLQISQEYSNKFFQMDFAEFHKQLSVPKNL